MEIEVEEVTPLFFDDGSPVRAASAIASLGSGWLVAQDDATHAAWWRAGSVSHVRVFPPVEGHEVFAEEAGTKHLKPDLEAACEVLVDGRPAVLMLGSGSSAARMRGALVQERDGDVEPTTADLTPLYAEVAAALSVELDQLNLEGACVVGQALRWFHRGIPAAGIPSSSIDLELAAVVAAVRGRRDVGELQPGAVSHYDLGEVDGVGLAATDAVTLRSPSDATQLLVSAAAEDTQDPREDGPVVGSALVVLDGTRLVASAQLPELDGRVAKVEGLALVEQDGSSVRVMATVDADDTSAPSWALCLRLRW